MILHEWMTLKDAVNTMMAFFNLCHNATDASLCLRIMWTINHTSEE
jgi:hypothetical protein